MGGEVSSGGTQRSQVIYVKTSLFGRGETGGGTGGLCSAPYHTKGGVDFRVDFLGTFCEGRERVNAAISNTGLEFPLRRITG